MSPLNQDRVEQLQQLIEANPDDPFPRYGLALEYRNAGQTEEAAQKLSALVESHPEYLAAYLHCGFALEEAGKVDRAADIFRRGIELAESTQDARARQELAAALSMLEN